MVFGYGLAVIIALASLRLGYKHGFGPGQVVFFLVAGLFAVITWRNPDRLQGVYRYWMAGARFIGAVFSTVVLAVMFYVVFAPVGLFLRLLRQDPLERAICPDKKTYWVRRPDAPRNREDYQRQF